MESSEEGKSYYLNNKRWKGDAFVEYRLNLCKIKFKLGKEICNNKVEVVRALVLFYLTDFGYCEEPVVRFANVIYSIK